MQDKALSVSQLNNYLKGLIENDVILSSIFVKGEISNFKQYGFGGQWYFTLKDEQAQINCVVFNNYIEKIKFVPKDGDAVIVKGRVTVFNKRGTYNLQVFWMEPEGLGALAKAFEQLKATLEAEGLFAAERKKELPRYPKKVAILAALEGAAVRDVITVAQRRDNTVELGVLPTIVQGTAAIASIIKNIELLQESDYEVIILARGGGSLEDLWAFNEEEVARAITGSRLPIVSAVGHEVDFTIADFVADLRAATPSVAAELVIPERRQYLERLVGLEDFLLAGLRRLTEDQYQQLDQFQERLKEIFAQKLSSARHEWERLSGQLETLNPLAVLKRGFAVVEKEGKVISSAKQLAKNDIITVTLASGSAEARVEGLSKK